MIEKQDQFIKEIEKISSKVLKSEVYDYNIKELKEAFFRQSSHSPDNVESMEYIEYGVVRDKELNNGRVFGLKIKNKDILLSDIVYFLEGKEARSIIEKGFPTLNLAEIKAAQRVITMIILGLQCEEIGLDE